MELYVGNLFYQTTEAELRELFSVHGSVASVRIISDHFTRQSKCFGYVEMPSRSEAQKALLELNGKRINDRSLVIKQARPRDERLGRGW